MMPEQQISNMCELMCTSLPQDCELLHSAAVVNSAQVTVHC